MPFLEQFTGERVDLRRVERLRAELPGIFNWALAGARRLYAQGGFTRCRVCEASVWAHRQDSGVFLQFAGERLTAAPENRIPCSELYKLYATYCEENGQLRLLPLKHTTHR